MLETQRSRRVTNYNERLTTGNIEDLCFVIREISRSGNTLPASAEGQILRNARATLAIELSLALTIDTAQAEAIIDISAVADEAPVAVNA
ncbi:MAG: Transcriptional regulator, CarD family [Cryobacterium sp.]|nr:Transcriptional regulator, CarD family [Cryobacterium sp.]